MLRDSSGFVGFQYKMVLRSAIAFTTLVISLAAPVQRATAQYYAIYGPSSVPAPYAPPPRAEQSYGGYTPGPAEAYPNYGSLLPEDQPETVTEGLPPQFQRQLVSYQTTEPAGTIIIDTPNTYLYLVLGHGKALRYGVGVGREGFTWAGPPAEMIDRQPYLPRFMAGGPGNPLGARALYLGNTLYRIHGTNQPSTIGQFVSSGCIRLLNEDIEDLYNRVTLGTRVVVLPGSDPTRSRSTMQ